MEILFLYYINLINISLLFNSNQKIGNNYA